MITFPRIKTVAYTINKRLQGYHLLQNPIGSPQTEVNMIRQSTDNINLITGQKTTVYRRIIRTVDQNGQVDINQKELVADRVYDYENKKYGKAKNISLFISNIINSKLFERNNIAPKLLDELPEHSIKETAKIKAQKKDFIKNNPPMRKNFFVVLYRNLTNKHK